MPLNFDILDTDFKVDQKCIVEASAGTGKTFSIQNIVTRLLLEPNRHGKYLAIEQILVVTFTRAATSELKIRIRKNIEQSYQLITDFLLSGNIQSGSANYLKQIFELEPQQIVQAKKRLQQALYSFEKAQIFTIHGFSARILKKFALQSNLNLNFAADEANSNYEILKKILMNFL